VSSEIVKVGHGEEEIMGLAGHAGESGLEGWGVPVKFFTLFFTLLIG